MISVFTVYTSKVRRSGRGEEKKLDYRTARRLMFDLRRRAHSPRAVVVSRLSQSERRIVDILQMCGEIRNRRTQRQARRERLRVSQV